MNVDSSDDDPPDSTYVASRKSIPFDIDEYIDRAGDKNKKCTCSRGCYRAIRRTALEVHAKAAHMYRGLSLPASEASRLYGSWVFSVYLMCQKEGGNMTGLKIPAFGTHKFCLASWLDLADVKRSTSFNIKQSVVQSRDIVREVHRQIGNQNDLNVNARQHAKNSIEDTAKHHAHPLPMSLSAPNGTQLGTEERRFGGITRSNWKPLPLKCAILLFPELNIAICLSRHSG